MKKKKIIAVVVSLMMVLSLIPFSVLADTQIEEKATEPAVTVNSEDQAVQPEENKTDEDAVVTEEEKDSEESVKAEEDKESRKDLLASYSVKVTQDKINYRRVKYALLDLAKIKSGKVADTVKVKAVMTYKGKTVQSKSVSKTISSIDTSSKAFTFVVPAYGKYTVTSALYKKGKKVKALSTKTVGITAEQYNIVTMKSTTPVLIYSLKFFGDDSFHQNETGDPIPTIVILSRYKQYNWNKLPANMYALPYLTKAENLSGKYDDIKTPAMKTYVKDLYSLNKKSKFNFYVNDYHIRELAIYAWENKLPQDNIVVRLVTDGSASYAFFGQVYAEAEDAQAVHDDMVTELKQVKKDVYSGKKIDYNSLKKGNIRMYMYAVLDVENDAQWWVVRKSAGDTFKIKDQTFQAKVVGDARVTSNYINNLLKAVKDKGNDAAFKALYNFDDSAFKATRKKGKKIMMILGSAKSVEDNQPITPYIRFLMAYYGEDFEYYYKGHPGYIPDAARIKVFEGQGCEILDASIAAELFVYYNPDIYMSGYSSSTFQNVESFGGEGADPARSNIGLFNMSMSDASANTGVQPYFNDLDNFVTNITGGSSDEKLQAFVEEQGIDKDNIYLVEFKTDDAAKQYKAPAADYAVWDDSSLTFYYFSRDDEGNCTLVKKESGAKKQTITLKKSAFTIQDTKSYDLSKFVTHKGMGKVTYTSSKPKVVTVNKTTGKITAKNTGKVTITVKASATGVSKAVSKKITLTVKPKKGKVKKASGKKKAAVIKVRKDAHATGYQILVARNKKFTKGKKSVKVKASKVKVTIKKLKGKKKYYVKTRSFKKISGKKVYGNWSKVKAFRTK